MATARSSLLLVLLAAAAVVQAKLPLPSYVRPCSFKLSNRKLSECALKSARELMPQVMKGDSKYNVPVLDPLYIDSLVVIDGKGPLGMQLLCRDVRVYGLPKMIINSVTHRSNPQDNTYVATVPEMHIEAKYNITGRILLLPIIGQGNVLMDLKNVKLIYQFDWKLEKLQDGEIYYLPQPGARLELDADGMTVKLDNLFNGDKALLETTNRFLNEEWREVFDSLKPSFSTAISQVITNILNGIFRQVTFKDSFLDVD